MQERPEPGAGDDGRHLRTDHRTGKPVLLRDAAFWQEHERKRLEQGLSMPAYCKANGLAISTYRHRMSGRVRKSTRAAPDALAKAAPAFTAVTPAAVQGEYAVEVLAEGMTLRLAGAAAERVVQRVLEKLA